MKDCQSFGKYMKSLVFEVGDPNGLKVNTRELEACEFNSMVFKAKAGPFWHAIVQCSVVTFVLITVFEVSKK